MNTRSLLLLLLALLIPVISHSHPMPNSVLLIDVHSNGVAAELQWPLKELQLIFPEKELDTNTETLITREGTWLDQYLRQHLHVLDDQGHLWSWQIKTKYVTDTAQDATGRFHELVFQLWLQPPAGSSPRRFTIHYDAIMHQLVTHKMLVSIRQDWDGGLTPEDSADAQLGVLMVNQADGKVPPLIVTLDEGNKWKGFLSMVKLGIAHIAEGTDHLLFLLVLLLPAPLLASGNRWKASGGTRYSSIRLLRITIAFTIGHSLTLIAGALGWIRIPTQLTEILIAVSILIGAIHAIRPLFPGKEAFVAAGFGLVHGLAFASTLAVFKLDAGRLALSILGFNVGIELMQLFVVLITVPWLIVLSSYRIYQWVRLTGGLLAGIAAIAWILERATGDVNLLTKHLDLITTHGNYLVLGLAILAMVCYATKKNRLSKVPNR